MKWRRFPYAVLSSKINVGNLLFRVSARRRARIRSPWRHQNDATVTDAADFRPSSTPASRNGGASVDLWRRVAEEMHWRYQFILVSHMDAILAGLEQDRFDAAIGAITITGERLARVDFSYPAHRSGVAVAFARKTGLLSALSNYRAAASELGTLLAIILGL